jgi:hypothetical protein
MGKQIKFYAEEADKSLILKFINDVIIEPIIVPYIKDEIKRFDNFIYNKKYYITELCLNNKYKNKGVRAHCISQDCMRCARSSWLGLRKTTVGATRLCAVFLRHIWGGGQCLRIALLPAPNVAYNRNVIRNAP